MPFSPPPQDTASIMAAFLSDEPPLPEAMAAAAGVEAKATRAGHRHPRLTSATLATLGSNGEVTVPFTRTFTAPPAVTCLLIEAADSQPVIFKVKTFIQDANGNITGAIIKGYRTNTLPASIGLLSVLVGFSVTSGSAANAQFACIAVQVSG